jgi:DNA-binding NarL/FixJ family response regulator
MNLLLADDHPLFRHGVRHALENDPNFTVLGEAGDGEEAVRMIEALLPDVAIVDISMPGLSGLEVVESIRQKRLPVEFIILSMYEDEEYFTYAMDLDVRGYVLKDSGISELRQALRFIAEGKVFVSPAIGHYLVKRITRLEDVLKKNPTLQDLTAMERQVLARIAENKTSKQIADELNISYRTVQNHRARITGKLGLRGYNKLLQFALENRSLL